MEVDRPPPAEELSGGEVTEPRQAASAIVLRDGSDGLEVLLVQRNPDASFMGGAWVFPGGALDAGDADHAAAAARELEEEAGLALNGGLVPFSRWITPAGLKVRFDTLFFVAAAPEGAEPRVDGAECVDARWLRPQAALDAHARGELSLVFPTIKHLEALGELGSVEAALEAASTRKVTAIEPRVVAGDRGPRVVLPGEPGYD
jgi:8-oxo-dGTP pyrophosphatase MutT (NUDIX family)